MVLLIRRNLRNVLIKYYENDELRDSEIDGACSMRASEMHTKFWLQNSEWKRQLDEI
jgi:hypothetical protein